MPSSGYFDTLFAASGDKTAVPDAAQPDGSVSYDQGFTVDYTLPIGDLDRKTVPRNQTNQLYYDITAAIQQLQQFSAPPFITTSMNGGSPFSYDKNVRVTSGGVIYQSLTNSNTTIPPGASWTSVLPVITSGTSLLKGNGSGGIANATAGTDYLTPTGNGSGLTGITVSQVSGLPFSAKFTSSQQTITFGGALTIAHGLGSVPFGVELWGVCTSGDLGYSVNDTLPLTGGGDGGTGVGISIVSDATNLNIRYTTSVIGMIVKDTGAFSSIDITKWKWVFKAFV